MGAGAFAGAGAGICGVPVEGGAFAETGGAGARRNGLLARTFSSLCRPSSRTAGDMLLSSDSKAFPVLPPSVRAFGFG